MRSSGCILENRLFGIDFFEPKIKVASPGPSGSTGTTPPTAETTKPLPTTPLSTLVKTPLPFKLG